MKKIKKEEFIHFSSLVNAILITVFLLCSCINTNNKVPLQSDDFQNIYDFFIKEHNFEITENINKIFVLSEKGCFNCNNSLARIIINQLNDTNSLFLITISGTIIDITPFEVNNSNVIINQNIDFNKYPLFQQSKVMYLKNNSIDTIIEINSDNLADKLQFIVSN